MDLWIINEYLKTMLEQNNKIATFFLGLGFQASSWTITVHSELSKICNNIFSLVKYNPWSQR